MKIPEDITIQVAGQSIPMTFAAFVRVMLDQEPGANDTGANIRAAMRVEVALRDVKPGEDVDLKGDHPWLRALIEAPAGGYPGLVGARPDGSTFQLKVPARQYLPFLDALA